MRVNFSRQTEFVPEWNGNKELPPAEQLKYALMPMDNGDYFDLQDIIGRLGIKVAADGTPDASQQDNKSARSLVTCVGEYLVRYVKSVGAPLLDQNDKEIPLEDIGKFAALIPLGMEILLEVAQRATPSKADSKN